MPMNDNVYLMEVAQLFYARLVDGVFIKKDIFLFVISNLFENKLSDGFGEIKKQRSSEMIASYTSENLVIFIIEA